MQNPPINVSRIFSKKIPLVAPLDQNLLSVCYRRCERMEQGNDKRCFALNQKFFLVVPYAYADRQVIDLCKIDFTIVDHWDGLVGFCSRLFGGSGTPNGGIGDAKNPLL